MSTKRDFLEAEAEVGCVVKSLQPSQVLMDLATTMFRKVWEVRSSQVEEMTLKASAQIKTIVCETDTFLDRIIAATNPQVIARYEGKIAELEPEKRILAEKQVQDANPPGTFEGRIEPLLRFLSSSWKLRESGSVHLRRIILKLAFADRIAYFRIEGVRTPEQTSSFNAIGGFRVWNLKVVGDPGIEPGVRLREGVTVPCHTLRPVAHCQALHLTWRRDY